MSYTINKAVELYFDTLLHFNICENNVTKFSKGNNVIRVETKEKTYIQTIKKNHNG